MPENAIGLMARYPRLGQVKNRLAACIGPQRAFDTYRQLLYRAVTLVCEIDARQCIRVAFIDPADAVPDFSEQHRGFDEVQSQTGEDLGDRMRHALEYLLSCPNISRACLIGADIPEISKELIEQTWRSLVNNDLILGPAFDGGYYLIGMKQVYPELFTGIKWGSSAVLEKTISTAETLGLTVDLLCKLRDIDNLDDFKHFTAQGVFK